MGFFQLAQVLICSGFRRFVVDAENFYLFMLQPTRDVVRIHLEILSFSVTPCPFYRPNTWLSNYCYCTISEHVHTHAHMHTNTLSHPTHTPTHTHTHTMSHKVKHTQTYSWTHAHTHTTSSPPPHTHTHVHTQSLYTVIFRPVKVIRLLGRNTVEEIILRRAEAKLQLTNAIIEGGQFSLGASKAALVADSTLQVR